MKVILIKDLPDVGRAGTVMNVAPGYARNYLYPKGFALKANEGTLRQLEKQRERAEQLASAERDEAKSFAERINGTVLSFILKAGEYGQLYGSVSQSDVIDALAEKGFELTKRQVILREGIKRVGNTHIDIRVLGDIYAKIRVLVEAEEVEVPKEEEEEASEATEEAVADEAAADDAEEPKANADVSVEGTEEVADAAETQE